MSFHHIQTHIVVAFKNYVKLASTVNLPCLMWQKNDTNTIIYNNNTRDFIRKQNTDLLKLSNVRFCLLFIYNTRKIWFYKE